MVQQKKENSETISRTEKFVSTGNQEYIAICIGKWLQAACQVLSWNSINKFVFPAAVREKGRKKHLSIFLVGPSNCGKGSILEPLEQIFNCFTNPGQGKYAWIGLDEAEVAYISNFCWSKELISWQELLDLLEGAPCKLSRHKSVFATELHIPRSNAIPIFTTGIHPIEYVRAYGLKDQRETAMMDSRWRMFEFSPQIPNNDIQEIPACSKCFYNLVMVGSAN